MERGTAGPGVGPSAWAQLRIRLFRTLWIASLVSNVGCSGTGQCWWPVPGEGCPLRAAAWPGRVTVNWPIMPSSSWYSRWQWYM